MTVEFHMLAGTDKIDPVTVEIYNHSSKNIKMILLSKLFIITFIRIDTASLNKLTYVF